MKRETTLDKNILVLMSTYNGSKYIKQQIESIFKQKNVNADILIRDDGSTDDTIDIINSFGDDRIKLYKGYNLGSTNSFIDLIKYSAKHYPDYEYYAFSDQDDVWEPEKIKVAVNALKKIEGKYGSSSVCVGS